MEGAMLPPPNAMNDLEDDAVSAFFFHNCELRVIVIRLDYI